MSIEKQIWDHLIAQGMTPHGAAGLMGNLYAESGLIPGRVEMLCLKRLREHGKNYTDETYTAAVDSGKIGKEEFLHPLPGRQYGYGLAQWTSPGRKEKLYNLVKSRGVSIADVAAQLDFLVQELNGNYKSVLKVLKSAKTVKEASDIVLVKYESPANCGASVKATRASYGQKYFNKYKEAGMTAADKRNTVVNFVKSREGKNQYTQSSKRTQVSSGYSDCSSLVWAAYCKINMAIGDYTGAQIGRGTWVTKGGSYPDQSKLLPGDLLFFASGSNNGRPYNVGHVEMYVGNGQISGHGSGTGPTRKNMVDYCKQRNSAGRPYIGVKRYIAKDSSDSTPVTGNNIIAAGQIHANNFCGSDLVIDGERGEQTKKAGIMVLQTAMNLDYNAGLEVDGVWGPKSDTALKGHYVKRGETQHMVTALEILFMLRGIECGGVESPGVFGEGLENAVNEFEGKKGWRVDGTAEYGTFISLAGVKSV